MSADDELTGREAPEPVGKVRADQLERADQAWRARVAGATWKQAADIAGYTDAANALRSVKRVYGALPDIKRDDLRDLWRDRLERLWRQALEDAVKGRSGAVTAAVRVEQAAAALDGLNSPSVLELSTPTRQEIDSLLAEVLALTRPQLEEADIFADDIYEAEIVEE